MLFIKKGNGKGYTGKFLITAGVISSLLGIAALDRFVDGLNKPPEQWSGKEECDYMEAKYNSNSDLGIYDFNCEDDESNWYYNNGYKKSAVVKSTYNADYKKGLGGFGRYSGSGG